MSAAAASLPGRCGRSFPALLLDLLLPCLCPGCQATAGPELCQVCAGGLERILHPCPACAAPRAAADADCAACAGDGLPHIAAAIAAFAYRGEARRLVGDAKAGARAAAVAALAPLLPLPILQVDAVVPVPPSPGRRPGPHLASACARLAARRLGVPCLRLLDCTRHAREQHLLSRADRARNVAGLFRLRSTPPARVLLVDDILTSGATACAAAAALRAGGAKRVVAAFLCRTP